MRALLAVSTLSAGGAERMASELVNRWAARGWTAALLTLSIEESDHYVLDSRVKRISLDLIWESRKPWESVASNLRRSRVIRRAIKQYAPDVVVSFIEQTNVRVLASLLGTRIPVIVSERTDPRMYRVGRVWEFARRVLYPGAQSVVVQTEAVACWAQDLVPKRKVCVIPNFVRHLPEPPPFSARERLILGVGRLDRYKRFDLLVQAFADSRACGEGWRLVILGEGSERARLERLVQKQGLQGRVDLPGIVPEPALLLGRARIFALTSLFEGFPNALLEAMAMGCAAVATDCPSGPQEIIRSGKNGLLVPLEDKPALVGALNSLMGHSLLAEELSKEAVKVRIRFAPERVLKQWDELIISVLNN
jgi:GalNAc-alpha-(1->4)-GalNAc-alpha-(1->3)-diNAcBac-PP-undecaprenol alpha-1,4-N-acetyl-D-galactosaminyltransferase